MYIPTLLILIAIAIGIYFYTKSNKNKSLNSSSTKKDKWEQAEEQMAKILKRCQGKDYVEKELKEVKDMRDEIIRIRERYKHETQKNNQIVQDWFDYTTAMLIIVNAIVDDEVKSSVGYGDSDDNLEDFFQTTKEPKIIVEEITKRINKEFKSKS